MIDVFFVCDESGAKGFSDKPEQKVREIGVVGGVLVPAKDEATIRAKMAAIAAKYPPSTDDKLHITGLSAAESEALRAEVFQVIKDHNLTCVYAATASEGYHQSFKELKDFEIIAARKKPERMVDLNPKLQPERLHAELFQQAFASVIAWCEDQYGEKSEVTVQVRTDPVEEKILKEFRAAADELTVGLRDQTQVLNYYDKLAKKPTSRSIQAKFKRAEVYGPTTKIHHKTEVDATPFTLLADVVVNSLYDHVKKRFEAGQTSDLNGPDAVHGHPLASSICGLNTNDGVPALSDVVHRHPDVKKPVEKIRVEIEEIKGDSLDV